MREGEYGGDLPEAVLSSSHAQAHLPQQMTQAAVRQLERVLAGKPDVSVPICFPSQSAVSSQLQHHELEWQAAQLGVGSREALAEQSGRECTPSLTVPVHVEEKKEEDSFLETEDIDVVPEGMSAFRLGFFDKHKTKKRVRFAQEVEVKEFSQDDIVQRRAQEGKKSARVARNEQKEEREEQRGEKEKEKEEKGEQRDNRKKLKSKIEGKREQRSAKGKSQRVEVSHCKKVIEKMMSHVNPRKGHLDATEEEVRNGSHDEAMKKELKSFAENKVLKINGVRVPQKRRVMKT
uniref:Uncharacterized protein n=1 Tax=Chromera velia CCMP2878 TaxID=1169474 RepID=A0A0G4G6K8_9ALVE|eukprot:Cvel_20447.t1-p1 / transcript=Cvel_20447.t1 / gene=Cvel_20447 / organism=Chromera_velia_CCMP2878 / gene_product=hypothetical protein / transcript_product=hypothetical protein / location=Cvel_scaffold1834:2980-5417(-) / protein_length=290 / sequence_SO=supercontig / SO=protein_coding / is_pseudo=false